ncbi:hypothetical protein PENSPDRAFT_311181 [Peniophora sp. CONT]|nr:hypothetical protein PENSPDRAFT_311181 [Peniophora sp. CONT]
MECLRGESLAVFGELLAFAVIAKPVTFTIVWHIPAAPFCHGHLSLTRACSLRYRWSYTEMHLNWPVQLRPEAQVECLVLAGTEPNGDIRMRDVAERRSGCRYTRHWQ